MGNLLLEPLLVCFFGIFRIEKSSSLIDRWGKGGSFVDYMLKKCTQHTEINEKVMLKVLNTQNPYFSSRWLAKPFFKSNMENLTLLTNNRFVFFNFYSFLKYLNAKHYISFATTNSCSAQPLSSTLSFQILGQGLWYFSLQQHSKASFNNREGPHHDIGTGSVPA